MITVLKITPYFQPSAIHYVSIDGMTIADSRALKGLSFMPKHDPPKFNFQIVSVGFSDEKPTTGEFYESFDKFLATTTGMF